MQLAAYFSRSVQLFVSIYFVVILFACLFNNVKLTNASASSSLRHEDEGSHKVAEKPSGRKDPGGEKQQRNQHLHNLHRPQSHTRPERRRPPPSPLLIRPKPRTTPPQLRRQFRTTKPRPPGNRG